MVMILPLGRDQSPRARGAYGFYGRLGGRGKFYSTRGGRIGAGHVLPHQPGKTQTVVSWSL